MVEHGRAARERELGDAGAGGGVHHLLVDPGPDRVERSEPGEELGVLGPGAREGLVEVVVGVDEPGRDDRAAEILGRPGRVAGAELGDESVFDANPAAPVLGPAVVHRDEVGVCEGRHRDANRTVLPMDVLTPRSLAEALELKAEHPSALPIQGGTDVMVALNFDRARPPTVLNLNEVDELRGWSRDDRSARLGAGLTYSEAMEGELAAWLPALAEASRTVGSPQIRNRGTIGGNLGTASPAGDAVPPLLVEGAEVECASVRGSRRVSLGEFVTGVKRTALEPDELITAVWLRPSGAPQTFMKIGPRNAMVIAVCSLALAAGEELRASFGSASPRPVLVTAPLDEADTFAERVAAATSPIDDVRGSAAYRRHAIRVLVGRALARTLAR